VIERDPPQPADSLVNQSLALSDLEALVKVKSRHDRVIDLINLLKRDITTVCRFSKGPGWDEYVVRVLFAHGVEDFPHVVNLPVVD
jgi:hypothetical protein